MHISNKQPTNRTSCALCGYIATLTIAGTHAHATAGVTGARTTAAPHCTHCALHHPTTPATAVGALALPSRCAGPNRAHGAEASSRAVALKTRLGHLLASAGTDQGARGLPRASGVVLVGRKGKGVADPGEGAGEVGNAMARFRVHRLHLRCYCCHHPSPRQWTHVGSAGRWAVPSRSHPGPCPVCA